MMLEYSYLVLLSMINYFESRRSRSYPLYVAVVVLVVVAAVFHVSSSQRSITARGHKPGHVYTNSKKKKESKTTRHHPLQPTTAVLAGFYVDNCCAVHGTL